MINNSRETTNSQVLTGNEAAASLAFATSLGQQLMPKTPQEAPQSPETAPGEAEQPEVVKDTPDPDFEALKAEFDSKLQEMEKSTKDTIRAEIGGLKDEIMKALNDDQVQ